MFNELGKGISEYEKIMKMQYKYWKNGYKGYLSEEVDVATENMLNRECKSNCVNPPLISKSLRIF